MTLDKAFYNIPSYTTCLFNGSAELLPSVQELFELELAYLEYSILQDSELHDRLAYFKSVNGEATKHFLMFRNAQNNHVNELIKEPKVHFGNDSFSSGYATHGLFPYRGKFHPQLIKALLNIIGIKKGDIVLDPMCGSGTTNIEAALMGIDSYAIDISPFCQYITKVKYNSLSIKAEFLKGITERADQFFDFFATDNPNKQLKKIHDKDKLYIYELILLAFLDSMGYSLRVTKSNHKQLFAKVLKKYEDTVFGFVTNNTMYLKDIGNLSILENADAKKIPLEDCSIDGVVTSPPYSFAIDYAKNDEAQLKYLGYDPSTIKSQMVGLIGKNKAERLEQYFKDMESVCCEVSRVLKTGKYFIMIIGSNTNQTGGIRLENRIIDSCRMCNLVLVKSILKPIKGLKNIMKDEYVLFFRKADSNE